MKGETAFTPVVKPDAKVDSVTADGMAGMERHMVVPAQCTRQFHPPLSHAAGMRVSYASLIFFAIAALTGCAAASPDSSVPASAVDENASQSRVECPAKDFDTFLQRFADPKDTTVRQRFTADPLAYEVPTHTLSDDARDLAPMHVEQLRGEARLEKFPFRYLKQFDTYVQADLVDSAETLEGLRAKTYSSPMSAEVSSSGPIRVTFGAEYEIDIYTFTPDAACWQLSRATNPRD